MVGKTEYSSVPTAADLENNSNQKKYTVNRKSDGLVISKPLCTLMAIGTVLLALLVGLTVFFLIPRCEANAPRTGEDGVEVSPGDGVLHGDVAFSKVPNSREVDERLPRNVEPAHYKIQILPYLNNLTTHGAVTIILTVKGPTNEIVFNVKDIEIDRASVKVTPAGSDTSLKVAGQDYIDGERYKVDLEEPLAKNIVYVLDLMYVGRLNNHLQGFYRSKYDEVENNVVVDKYLASTQFSPTDARRAFPCFDEPSFKANFSIVIGRPKNMTSLSNMPLEKSDPDAGETNLVWDYYRTTPKMPTYLVAFLVSDLQGYRSSDKLITVWSRKSSSYHTRYSAELAPKVLNFFERYFTLKFPLPKIDVVAVPDFGYSAMENWGLITFRESALLYSERDSDIDNKRDVATILSHELGHQWFGNLVTPKWWNDLWLKEGFATYLQYLGADFAEPSWKITEEFLLSETTRSFDLDALPSSRPISFEVKNNRQIRQTFDELSYGKGACVIRMMNHFLGEEAFKSGLINFLKKYQYSNADRDDLFASLTEEAHRLGALNTTMSVKVIMDSWTAKPGFPVVTAVADRTNRKLVLSQKRFYFADQKNDSATWWVPVSVANDVDRDFGTKPRVWLKDEPTVTTDLRMNEWYLININHTGYYVVNYDETNWNSLTDNIMNLPPLIRAQLISDSMDLARANLLDYHVPLKLVQKMALHDQNIMFVPTAVAFQKLQYLSDMLSNTPIFGLFEDFQSTIFKKTYQAVGADREFYSDDYLKQRIRRAVLKWACRKTDSECAINAHHVFRGWMEKHLTIPPNVRDVTYCTAVRQGNEAEWNFAYEQYLETTSVSEKNVLLDALGCTTKKWLLARYLDILLRNNSSIKIQDAGRVFQSVADNNAAASLAFDFLRMHWNELLSHYGEGFNIVSKMVKSLPRYMNTEYQLSELVRFRNEVKNNLSTASQAFDSAIEKVRGNVQWMKKNYHSVEQWFTTHKEHFNL